MKALRIITISTLLMASFFVYGLLPCAAATPVWPQDGVAVCTNPDSQYWPIVVPDDSGGTIIIWETGQIASLHAQRLNKHGIPQWAEDGVHIADIKGEQQQAPLAIADGYGGAIVVWMSDLDIYAQRINANGTPQWNPNGVAVSSGGNNPYPRITSDGSGGVIIAWHNNDSGLHVQRVDGSGTALWGANGIDVCTTDTQGLIGFLPEETHGTIIFWNERREPGDSGLYAQRFNGSGIPQWTSDGKFMFDFSAAQRCMIPCSGGGIIAWQDTRDYESNGYDIYAQRFSISGETRWAPNGVPVCKAPKDQGSISMISDGRDGAIIAWEDERSWSNKQDIYAQRINASGNPLWGKDGAAICASINNEKNFAMASDGLGGAFVAWQQSTQSQTLDGVYAKRIDADGNAGQKSEGLGVCLTGQQQMDPSIAYDGEGGVVIAWEDFRKDAREYDYGDIYAQRLTCEEPYTTWYLAEGCTAGDFETWILVQNPNDEPVDIDMVFHTDAGMVQGPQESIPASSRKSYNAGTYVLSYDVSTEVRATRSIVCERAMYGNNRGWGHNSIGVTAPSQTWYLAEGCTAGDFETWILVQNPNDEPVDVDMVFHTDAGMVQGPQESIPANSRKSYNAAMYVVSYDVSTQVTSSGRGIICERAMYGNNRAWGHNSIGATSPASIWALAEGCTAGGFETWLLVQNPSEFSAGVNIDFITDSGTIHGPQLETIPPNSRKSYNVGKYVESYNVSTIVHSFSGWVICERAMYREDHSWGHDSVGVKSYHRYPELGPVGSEIWCLAEGCTEGGFETWILIQNPNDSPVKINMIFQTDTSVIQGPQEEIPSNSRNSYFVGSYVRSFDVSTKVTASRSIVCERAMYGNQYSWGHNSIGFDPVYGGIEGIYP